MPTDSVNIEKHIKTYLSNKFVITENAKLKKYFRKTIHHKHLRQLTLRELELYSIIIKPMNTFKRILLVVHFVMPAGGDRVRISKYCQRGLEIFNIFKLGRVTSTST
jgi:hypothetical protein